MKESRLIAMLRAKLQGKAAAFTVGVIFLAAFLVRVWGIAWDNGWARHHDERIHLQTALSFYRGELSTPRIWLNSRRPQYAFYSWFSMYAVAGVLKLYSGLDYAWSMLISIPLAGEGERAFPPGYITQEEALLIGRLTVAVMGAATVLVVYGIGRVLWNRKIGLLAAAFLAFNGYHVANCHWLKNDVAAVFFLSLGFFYIAQIFRRGKWKDYILAPLFCALAINSKYYVVPVVPVVVIAHFLGRNGAGGSGWKKIKSVKLLVAFLALVVFLVASFPPAYLDYSLVRSRLVTELLRMPKYHLHGGVEKKAAPISFFRSCYLNLFNFARYSSFMEHGMGIYVTLLGLGGMILAFGRRERRLLLLASFPAIFLILSIPIASPGIRVQDTVPLYPFFSLLAAVFLYRALEFLLRKKWLLNLGFGLIGLAVLVPYLIAVTRMSYGFWQLDTVDFTTAWANKNIPPGSLIAKESKTAGLSVNKYRLLDRRALCSTPVRAYHRQGFDYLITSRRHEGRALDPQGLFGPEHRFGKFYLSLESEYDLVKIFDLGEIPYKGGPIKVYQRKGEAWLAKGGLNSGLLRHFQNDFSPTAPEIIFLNRLRQAEGNTNFWVSEEAPANKLLVSPAPLAEIGVQVVNGSRPTTIRIKVTGKKIKVRLRPRESRQFIIKPGLSFPFLKYSYRIKVSSSDSYALIRVLPDPYRMGLGYWEMGDWERAISCLEEAARQGSEDWSVYYLLASAYHRLGEEKKAEICRTKILSMIADFPEIISRLTREKESRQTWNENFLHYSGYDPVWLEDRVALHWEGNDLREEEIAPGRKLLASPASFPLPSGTFRIQCSGLTDGSGMKDTVFAFTLKKNSRPLFRREVKGGELENGGFSRAFENRQSGSGFSFQIEGGSELNPRDLRVSVSPSLRDWLEEYWGGEK